MRIEDLKSIAAKLDPMAVRIAHAEYLELANKLTWAGKLKEARKYRRAADTLAEIAGIPPAAGGRKPTTKSKAAAPAADDDAGRELRSPDAAVGVEPFHKDEAAPSAEDRAARMRRLFGPRRCSKHGWRLEFAACPECPPPARYGGDFDDAA